MAVFVASAVVVAPVSVLIVDRSVVLTSRLEPAILMAITSSASTENIAPDTL
jgi:hypothetical protein